MAPEQTAELPRPELSAAKRALLDAMLRGKVRSSGIVRRAHPDGAPLSFAQERLWFLDQLDPGSAAYNVPGSWRLRGALDEAALERALGEIVRRHDALRTTFREVNGSPVQVIAPFDGFTLRVDDLSGFPAADRDAEATRRATEDAALPFDLAAGPLFRAALLRLGEESRVLLLSMHHIVSDGWSMGVFFRELTALYMAYHEGRESSLPELPVQYADYAVWQREHLRGPLLERQLSYWRERLAGAPELVELPTDRPRPAVRTHEGATEPVELPAELLERLRAVGRGEGATLFMVVLAAFQVLLSRYSGSEDIVVGSPMAGRTRNEVAGLIGFFVNTLVLRTELGGDPSFREVLRRVQEVTLGAYDHQDLPFEKLVAELRPERSMSHSPLFQVSFTLDDVEDAQSGADKEKKASGEAESETAELDPGFAVAKFDLALGLLGTRHGLIGALNFSTDLFERGTIVRMLGHLARVLEQVAADPDVRLSQLQLLSADERGLVVEEWNRTERESADPPAHALFAEWARRAPEAVALLHGRDALTYGALDRRAAVLARHLRALGVGPETPVGLCMERTPELLVGVLGIWKAGGAYVPLDPGYPAERLGWIMADAALPVVVATAGTAGVLPEHGATLVRVDQLPDPASETAAAAEVPASDARLAYVIYTSGSTGKPKGVLVEHGSLANLLAATRDSFGVGAGDVMPALASYAFDIWLFEALLPLTSGAAVRLVDRERVMDVPALVREIADATLVHAVPALMRQVVHVEREAPRLARLRRAFVGGDRVAADLLAEMREALPGAESHVLYGPTEGTILASTHPVPVDGTVYGHPIGTPLGNVRVYVCDALGGPQPAGIPGELLIGGAGVARGYLGRPAMTAERFVPDPFSAKGGARLYRTGDRARWRADGTLEFLGRTDFQVKVRGFRIEPGEIEALLRQREGVRECAVLVREDAGEQRLVAYVVGDVPTDELREHARRSLPEYMVPSAIVALDALPLTPNGKLDRKALPAPDYAAGADRYVAPRTPAEEVLAGIWAEVLHLERVGVEESFFDLGGHSLLATRVVSRVRELFGVELPLRALFEGPTVAELALRVEGTGRAELPMLPPVVPTDRTGLLPLSFAQERLWFIDRLEPGSATYNIPMAWHLGGVLDEAALERSLGEIVRRHEVLRTVFAEVDGSPVQVVAPFLGFTLPVEDLSGLGEADRGEAVRRRAAEEARRPFDLAAGPLFRAALLRVNDEEHVLLLSMHHIVSDGWSSGVLSREFSVLYEAYREGRESPLPELPVQYADYAVWQREQLAGEVLDRQLAYWRERLAGAPELLELPTDRPRPPVQTFQGASVPVELSLELLERLQALGRSEGATLYMTLLSAFQVLLGKYAGSEDVVVGSPIAGRTRGEVEELIGFFVNTLVLRTDLSGDPSFREVLRRVREATLGAYAHQEVPFEKLVAELQPERSLSHSPLFQVLFTVQNAGGGGGGGGDALAGLRVGGIGAAMENAKFDLSLELAATPQGLGGGVNYSSDLFERGTIVRMLGHLARVLEQVAADADVRLSGLELLGDAEREQVLQAWNRTEAEYPADRPIHALFEAQAARTPDAVAVRFQEQSLTYAELNAGANQLAHSLRRRGVGPEVRVGICLERGLEMVVSILAVLKAGGAYVPLDPGYPAERLSFILADSAVPVLLTRETLRGALPALEGVQVVSLDSAAAEIAAESAENPQSGAGPDSLAYVIYTSGSTGTPKGALIEHRNVARLFSATDAWFGFGPDDVWTLFHSYAFDFSVWELWGALLHGGRVIVVPFDVSRDPEAFHALVQREGVTVLNQTPSAFRQFIRADGQRGGELALRVVVFGGEALEPASLREWVERRGIDTPRLVNMYGITETTVHVTYRPLGREDVFGGSGSPIGRAIPDLRLYVLDPARRPLPVGIPGELYVGGAGVARGYLNRPELTAERFVDDPFAPGRLYRSGDRVRWMADGTLEYLGRLDEQVKIRGFRIELGEIEAALRDAPGVADCTVVVRDDESGDQRLVAYVVGDAEAEALRDRLRLSLPEYMVPAAFVALDALPLTPNGKLDRKALPAPEGDAYARGSYEAPLGEVETALAEIWAEVLGVERVGRRDHFFELGGHSLLAIRLIERMRRAGLYMEVRALFTTPVLAELALVVGGTSTEVEVPANAIPEGADSITPEMLPLVELGQAEIDRIVAGVPGGAANVQDIYPLAPLQEGILFHHLLAQEGDPYLLSTVSEFDTRARLDQHLAALQAVIDRHDILRTAMAWEELPEPVQVVWRHAPLRVEEVEVASGPGARPAEELWGLYDPRHYQMDLTRAPLLQACIAEDRVRGRWVMLMLRHHLTSDHESLEVLEEEISAHLQGRESELPAPLPFRNYVAQARLGVSREEHERFFRGLLGDVEEPTAPYGLLDVWGEGHGIREAWLPVADDLAARLRRRARALGVSAASLCHLAWAQVLARVSGRSEVVFGTLLFGRMQGGEGADRVMGPFINTLPVRIGVGEEGVEAAVRRTHALMADLLRHEHASLALAQRSSGVAAPAPLFTSLLNYRYSGMGGRSPQAGEAGAGQGEQAGQPAEGVRSIHAEERTNYPVVLSVDDMGDAFSLVAQVAAPAEAVRVCRIMHTALERLVEALEATPGRAIGSLDVLPEAERRQVVEEWNRTERPYPRGVCIHELFDAQVRERPESVALVWGEESLTYRELDARANQLANHLAGLGAGPDSRVGVLLERSAELVVSMLAVLKAGGCYVPLDPGYPPERLRLMLADSSVRVLLTRGDLAGVVEGGSLHVVQLDEAAGVLASESTEAPRSGAMPENLAYIVYTSGSTGKPKGVMVAHRHVVQLVVETDYVQIRPGDRVAQASNASFDALTFEAWGAFLNGATLVGIPRDVLLSPAALREMLREERITTLYQTTALLNQLSREQPDVFAPLRDVLFGGQAADADSVRRLLKAGGPERLVHVYGPTETTAWCSWEQVAQVAEDALTVSVGRPTGNQRIYLLDSTLNPAPVGVPGEAYVGGDGVVRGYLDRPGLTAERFLPDPFATEPGARMYRTGDRLRWEADGRLEFIGRVDEQVKVRGFRIEPGEIEATLTAHADVQEARVIVREDVPGEQRLVAYVIGSVDAEELRVHLRESLPEYMVPAAFVTLERLPLTPNGKLDRKALPAPEGAAFGRGSYEAPLGEIEAALAEIWAEVLGVEKVGRWDHFFELGGHSLLAIRLIERMRRVGLYMDVRVLFTTPVLAELALAVGGASSEVEVPANRIPEGAASITPDMLPLVELSQADIDGIVAKVPGGAANVQDIYPLAPLQEGILFHHLMSEEGDPYLLSIVSEFDTRARLDQHLAALQAVIGRHDVLRTAIAWEGLREAVQVVLRHAPLPVEEVELDAGAGARPAEELWRRYDPRRYRMDVTRAPLQRAVIAEDRVRGRWLLLMLVHHLMSDHASHEVQQEEIAAHLLGRESELPAPLPFRNYVAQARLGVSREEHERFFRGMLGDVEEPTAPYGMLDVWGEGHGIGEARILVAGDLSARLRRRARTLGVSAASLCHLAWGQVLARVSGRSDVVFGTLLFGRMQGGEGAERVMGPLINTLPVRIGVGEEGAEAAVRRTHALLADLLRHEHASLALAQRSSGVAAPAPLFTSLLNYRHGGAPKRSQEGAGQPGQAGQAEEGVRGIHAQERTNYPVVLSVDDLGDEFSLAAQVAAPAEAMQVCRLMHTALERLVEALETAPGRAIGGIDVLPEVERTLVLEEWNRTDAEYPAGACIHQLFEAQAARTPGAVAVVFEGSPLTYDELNRSANRLAHHLRGLGVGPDARVAICVERGPEMIAALLAILKAGGGYVPLDPAYPAGRLRSMLEDSAPAALVTQSSLAGTFAGLDLPVVELDAPAPAWADGPETNPAFAGLTPGHLAYVIYTSGSTGRPKGVMVEHRSLVNHTAWQAAAFGIGAADTVLQRTSVSFDASVWELWTPLATGARMLLLSSDAARDPGAIGRAVEEGGVTVAQFVPTLLQAVLGALPADRSLPCRVLFCGGEPLPAALVQEARAAGVGEVVNLYGPTEATIDSTWHPCLAEDGRPPAIGRPVANARIYVLDARGEPAPVGVAGELYVGGAGVARGYLGRAGLTAERFVPDPFSGVSGARMYRTGDLGRWKADGTLEFLGRTDFQVKVRGFRIEPGEIEAVLRQHESVAECVVLARADAGETRLVAYVVGEAEAEALRTHLRASLPEYMVPAAFVSLEALPLTPNGKLDRKALPAPELASAAATYVAPRTPVEEVLAEIWVEVLRLERVGVHDSFFDLGGHSLLIMRLLAKIQATFDLEISIRTVFSMPTLEAMAGEIERRIYEDVATMSESEAEQLAGSSPAAGA
ncbi:MAG TPA: amino acid adenylation domain-containing protein [Longimicrobium sp.]|jgi:amino acid adenylation domain-containing protein|uniref:amino acid adenylation domain-containing protein n=1 Tax=Longimicrobium sp. TaxID=2029185 RepID=UPI002ED7E37F